MKRFVLLPFILFLCVITATTAFGQNPDAKVPNSYLQIGAKNDVTAVKTVQQALTNKGFFKGAIDGLYGPLTQQAVISFQKMNGLDPDGIVGAGTWAKITAPALTPSPSPTPTPVPKPSTPPQSTSDIYVEKGDTGDLVKQVQSALAAKNYYTGPIDGQFGSQTEQAVIKFQKDNKLIGDGIVGPGTWALLKAAAPTPTPTPIAPSKQIVIHQKTDLLSTFPNGNLVGVLYAQTISYLEKSGDWYKVSVPTIGEAWLQPDVSRPQQPITSPLKSDLKLKDAQAMILSHLVYSDLDSFQGQRLTYLNDTSKDLSGFTSTLSGLKSEGLANKSVSGLMKMYDLSDWIVYKTYSNKNTGFYGAIFYYPVTQEYIAAFRGTDDKKDITDDVLGPILGKFSLQSNDAKTLLNNVPDKSKVSVTGHSLGGFLAQMMSVTYNIKGTTFNAPGFQNPKGLDEDMQKLYITPEQWANNTKGKYDNLITNYSIYIDKLSRDLVGFHGTSMGKRVGLVYAGSKNFSDPTGTSITHGISNFYAFFPMGASINQKRSIPKVNYYDSPFSSTYTSSGVLPAQDVTLVEVSADFDSSGDLTKIMNQKGGWFRAQTSAGLVFIKITK